MNENETEESLLTTFLDNKGRQWDCNITVGVAMDLRSKMNLDINKLIDPKSGLIQELIMDSWKLVDILLLITESQRESRSEKVTDKDFAHALTGEVLDRATTAFLCGVANSLKKLQRRAFAAVIRHMTSGMEIAATKMVERMDQEAVKKEKEMSLLIGNLSFDALASSGSTHDPSP